MTRPRRLTLGIITAAAGASLTTTRQDLTAAMAAATMAAGTAEVIPEAGLMVEEAAVEMGAAVADTDNLTGLGYLSHRDDPEMSN